MFMKLGEMIDVDSAMNPQHFWTDRPADIRIRSRINAAIRIRDAEHFCLKFWRWRRFVLCEHSLLLLVVVVVVVVVVVITIILSF